MRVLPLLFSLLLVIAGAAPLGAQDRSADGRFTWIGQVLEAGTDRPIEAAELRIDELRIWTLTDSLGRFAFPRMLPGTYDVTVSRLGFAPHIARVEVREGEALRIRLDLQPVMLAGVRAAVDRLQRRMNAAGYAVRSAGERELLYTNSPNAAEYVRTWLQLPVVGCPGNSLDRCVLVRGRPARPRIFLDDMLMPQGWLMLEHYQPQELYRIEVVPGLAMVRVYTRHYMDRLAATQQALQPICIVC